MKLSVDSSHFDLFQQNNKAKQRNIHMSASFELSSAHSTLCSHFASTSRLRKRQPFEKQKQGQRQRTLNLFEAAATYCSRGDLSSLLISLINKHKHEETRKELVTHLLATNKISPIVLQIKQAHDSAKTDIEKQKLLRLVSTELSRKQLEELYDWKVGVTAWRSSQKQPQTPKKPPNCKPLKQTTLQRVNQFYTNNTNPAGNTTRYDKGTQVHVPARSRSLTKKQLHTQYSEEHSKEQSITFSYSTFCRLEPNFVTKAKRKLDMCELCVRGEEVERELAKRRRVGSSFEGLSTDEADSAAKNLHLYKAHKSVVSSQHQSYKAQQENLKPGEVLVVLDFKENLQVGSGPIEVGNDYYSKTQVSCLGLLLFTIGGNTTTHYFDCISFSLS